MSSTSGLGGLAGQRGFRQFVKFGIVGASGFVVNLIIFTLLQRVVPNHASTVPFLVIFSIAFLCGGVSNYFLNRAWTFRSTGHVAIEGIAFLGVSALALVFALLISQAVAPWLGHGHKTWFVSTVGAMFVNFFVNKYWTFRSVL